MELTPNRIVSFNLRRARELRGMTQKQAAERLEPYLGAELSTEAYAQAERAAAGHRVRHFNADELHAFTRAFGLPLTFFFAPPRHTKRVHHADVEPEEGETAPQFVERVLGMDEATRDAYAESFANDEHRTLAQDKLVEMARGQVSAVLAEAFPNLRETAQVLLRAEEAIAKVKRDPEAVTLLEQNR